MEDIISTDISTEVEVDIQEAELPTCEIIHGDYPHGDDLDPSYY